LRSLGTGARSSLTERLSPHEKRGPCREIAALERRSGPLGSLKGNEGCDGRMPGRAISAGAGTTAHVHELSTRHYRAAAARERSERLPLRDPVIHDDRRCMLMFLMDYRDSSAPQLAFRSRRAVERGESPARQL